MRILVVHGRARLQLDAPVFLGTTAKTGGSGYFDAVDSSIDRFEFIPERGDSGTLVFDNRDPSQRKSLSATFVQFRWDDDKLVVTEKLDIPRLKYQPRADAVFGLHYTFPDGIRYYSGKPSSAPEAFKRVDIVALIKFLEGKIDRAELDRHVIEK